MISVDEALARLFALVTPVDVESVPLRQASGRVLRRDVVATRHQPPFDASAMDGYAVIGAEAVPGADLRVIGTSSAGHAFPGGLSSGEAVRIFTGAPVPAGADRVVIQEDVTRSDDRIVLSDGLGGKSHVRPAGCDFRSGDILRSPRRLRPVDLSQIAAMNTATVTVSRRLEVAIIATGDELVMPGEHPRDDQIIASNAFALAAMVENEGAVARVLPIARDEEWALEAVFDMAADADLIVTIGGASVGDHDLVGKVAMAKGLDRAFYKIAMRPGKPLMAGRMGDAVMIGLPGNPVSSIVCGHVFVIPMLRAMAGLPAEPVSRRQATLTEDLPPNGPREHYMRARLDDAGLAVFEYQDSSLLSVLSDANALLIRPANDGERKKGEVLSYLPL